MQSTKGCLGRIVPSGRDSRPIEIQLDKRIIIGRIDGIMFISEGTKLMMLFIIPAGAPQIAVFKSGRRQAGAFLLEPDECFSLGNETYQLKTEIFIEVSVEKESPCAFCRSPLKSRGAMCVGPVKLPTALRGKILCEDCVQVMVSKLDTSKDINSAVAKPDHSATSPESYR